MTLRFLFTNPVGARGAEDAGFRFVDCNAIPLWCGLWHGEHGGLSEPQTITVFAASSLTDVLTEITEDFQVDHPGVHVVRNLAGSQELRLQLEHGAQADVFLPADPRQMELAAAAGLLTGPPVVLPQPVGCDRR